MIYKLSVIIPVYNVDSFIDECLKTIISELNTETEVLLLDDGSKDSSLEKCRRYESVNVRVFHHDNHGVSYTRNRGISESTGEYIMFVDADDVLLPGWSEVVFSAIEENLDIVYFSSKLDQSEKNKISIVEGIFGIKKKSALVTMASPGSKIFKKKFLSDNEITFDRGLINGEDALFNLEAVIKCESLGFVMKSLYRYRIYGNSSTKTFNPGFFQSNLLFLQKAETLILESGMFAESEKEFIINFSFSYSVYLYLFLISRIRNNKAKLQEIKKLSSSTMLRYFKRFPVTVHPAKIVQISYNLAKHNRNRQAMFFINILNVAKGIRNKFRSKNNTYYFIEM